MSPIIIFAIVFLILPNGEGRLNHLYDICGVHNGRRLYIDFGEKGSLTASYQNNLFEATDFRNSGTLPKKCTIEFLTCPSCIVEIKFSFLNISRNCAKATVFDVCGCDYIWIYEPPFEEASGEQFCGRFIQNNATSLNYNSQTKSFAVTFTYYQEYGHAFTLNYSSEKNRVVIDGFPKIGNINNSSQTISSPFFPYNYPSDLSLEYVINCKADYKCRISLIFTDFQIADSSFIEFFDWNGQRMYVTSGKIFRPPVITTTGPTLVVRFYANGATSFGYKAHYSFLLGDVEDLSFKPDTGCGGHVNNLGGAITMMDMVMNGTKFYDCVWLVKPASGFLHLKTHLYIKVITFEKFVGNTELIIRQGLTSNEPSVGNLRSSMPHFMSPKGREHVGPITQGFYVSFRGYFKPESHLAIAYAAFNYRDCFAGSDFLCRNLRCISVLLNCDGFDHCGDSSDEASNCSEGISKARDRLEWSKIPNFLFPKIDRYSDLTAATLIFLTCSFGLIGIIFAMALLLWRVNIRAHHRRQIQDHIETIHAILEDSVSEIDIETITQDDDPPDYEAPPDYVDVIKLQNGLKKKIKKNVTIKRCTANVQVSPPECNSALETPAETAGTSISPQTSPVVIPESPPPAYAKEYVAFDLAVNSAETPENEENHNQTELNNSEITSPLHLSRFVSNIGTTLRESLRKCKSLSFTKSGRRFVSLSEENLVRYFSDSELINGNFQGYIGWPKTLVNHTLLRKSFSTDDITLL